MIKNSELRLTGKGNKSLSHNLVGTSGWSVKKAIAKIREEENKVNKLERGINMSAKATNRS